MNQDLFIKLLGRASAIVLLTISGFASAASDQTDVSKTATQVMPAKAEPGPDDPRIQLLAAILLDDERGVAKLLAEGVDPNIREQKRGPAIIMALQEKSFGAARKLLASDQLDVEAVNARGETALMMAALVGSASSVGMLLEKGASVDKQGWTALHYAASGGHNNVIEKLLAAGADIDAVSPNGTTALMLAARGGSMTSYETLLKAGADPRILNEANISAADYLEKNGETDRARLLRAYSAGFQPK